MNQIILASHGNLSLGMKQSVEMLIGKMENIFSVNFFRDDDQTITNKVENLIQTFDKKDKIYILTDIFGGSVNNDLMKLMLRNEDVYLIAGMNLGLVISIAVEPNKISEKRLEEMIKENRQTILFCNKLIDENIVKELDE